MSVDQESPAVSAALRHVEAWSNHDWEPARRSLAQGVRVTATTTQPFMEDTDLAGIDDYMHGLREFADAVVPGSLVVNASLGDERNALLMVTVEAALGPGGAKVMLPAARLYLLDDKDKISFERVVFFAAPELTPAAPRSVSARGSSLHPGPRVPGRDRRATAASRPVRAGAR